MTAQDLYSQVTAQIVTAIESGNLRPWSCPWQQQGGGYPLRHNGTPYRGCNVLWLWMTAAIKGHASPFYMTFQQAREYGGCVRKGEKSTPVLFCQPMTKATVKEDGSEGKDSFWIAKSYNVFNADQIDGLPGNFTAKPVPSLDAAQRIENADTFIANTGAAITHGPGGAYYRPSEDKINLPPFETFTSPEGYAATALHELQHWTGAKHRLDRDLKGYGSRTEYAAEEIIAELGAAMTCAQLGIPQAEQHAAYIGHWLTALREDARYIFTAASKAQRAVDYLNGLQPQP